MTARRLLDGKAYHAHDACSPGATILENTKSARAMRAATELARTASHLAYEAATLAQMFDDSAAQKASLASAQASIQAAKRVFALEDDQKLHQEPGPAAVLDALRLSRDALDEAYEAIGAARACLDAAIAFHARAEFSGGEASGAG